MRFCDEDRMPAKLLYRDTQGKDAAVDLPQGGEHQSGRTPSVPQPGTGMMPKTEPREKADGGSDRLPTRGEPAVVDLQLLQKQEEELKKAAQERDKAVEEAKGLKEQVEQN